MRRFGRQSLHKARKVQWKRLLNRSCLFRKFRIRFVLRRAPPKLCRAENPFRRFQIPQCLTADKSFCRRKCAIAEALPSTAQFRLLCRSNLRCKFAKSSVHFRAADRLKIPAKARCCCAFRARKNCAAPSRCRLWFSPNPFQPILQTARAKLSAVPTNSNEMRQARIRHRFRRFLWLNPKLSAPFQRLRLFSAKLRYWRKIADSNE